MLILLSSTINAQTINSKGKITEKTDDYVIYVVFQEKHLLEKAIPTEVINHCEGLTPKKNTYLFNHVARFRVLFLRFLRVRLPPTIPIIFFNSS